MQREIIERCLLNQLHKPINPHAQRLLAASKRAATPVPEAKAKAKASGKAKAKAKAKEEGEKTEKTATPYSVAKQKFMDDPTSLS